MSAAAPPQEQKFLTQIEICRRLGISDETWRRWRKRGDVLPPADLPGHPRWPVAYIEKFERGHRPAPGRRTFFGGASRRRSAA
jgi:hypothetical protein